MCLDGIIATVIYFTVHEKHYAFLGDDFVVEDVFENHCSTKIPIYLLGLCENDRLIYNNDLGDDHFFLLTVSKIEIANKILIPRVTGARGKNLFQYEPQDNDEEAPCSRVEDVSF